MSYNTIVCTINSVVNPPSAVETGVYTIVTTTLDLVSPQPTADNTPLNPPSFSKSNVAKNTTIVFPTFTVGGMTTGLTTTISITNGQYSLDEGVTWTSLSGTVAQARPVMVRHTSSASAFTVTTTTLVLGTAVALMTSQTGA